MRRTLAKKTFPTKTVIGAALLALSMASTWAKDEAPTAPDGGAVLAKLACLTGIWEGPMWGGTFRAQYGAPSKDTLLSYSRLRRGDKTAFYEFEVFEVVDKKLRLTPHPGGKPAASFELTAFDEAARKATFESPENAFPSRIVYHRNAEDALTITLTAPHHKSDKTQTFALKRVK
jgi:hypothetical protein